MKNFIYILIGTLLIFASCKTDDKNDVKPKPTRAELGIVEGKVETYFNVDTVFNERKIYYSLKEEIPNFSVTKPEDKNSIQYNILMVYYGKESDSSRKWNVNFFFTVAGDFHKHGKYILKVDDKIVEEHGFSTNLSEATGNDVAMPCIGCSTADNSNIGYNLFKTIANSKKVEITFIGGNKDTYLLSPEIIERSKIVLEYFEKLKDTTPIISY